MASNKVQEGFVVRATHKKFVRQDRHEVVEGEAVIRFHEESYVVDNYSPFGICLDIEGKKKASLFDKGQLTGIFIINGLEVQTVSLVKIRATNVRAMFEIIGEPLNVNAIKGVEAANSVRKKQKALEQKFCLLKPEFKSAVYEIKEWLNELKAGCDQYEDEIEHIDPPAQQSFIKAFAETLSRYLQDSFPLKHLSLLPILSELSDEAMGVHINFYQKQMGDLIHEVPVSNHAFFKPNGYAGDYEVMNCLYRNNLEGKSLFAKSLHHYFINQPAAQAVRNRCDYMKQKIEDVIKYHAIESGVRILSVACGPTREMAEFTRDYTDGEDLRIEFVALDQDEDSLKYAQGEFRKHLSYKKNITQKLIHMAIKNIIVSGLPESDFDLIYSGGLFDYLSDPVAQLAAKKLFAALKPGGQLIVGNFSYKDITLSLMSLVWDWHLIYRSEDDLCRLFGKISPDLTIEKENLGINLFCVLKN